MNPNAPVFVPSPATTLSAPTGPARAPANKPRNNRRPKQNGMQGSSNGGQLSADANGKVPNELLGFKYARHVTTPSSAGPRRTPRRAQPYNKERFMLANCQFLIRTGRNYNVHAVDADAMVDWDCVVQVRVFSTDDPTCPICLAPPVAGRVTKCGHVYCAACILHYLALGDRAWRKCPICYESVYPDALRSVQVISRAEVRVGDALCLKLMQKAKGSTAVMTRARWQPCTVPYYTNDDAAVACTLLLISPQDALDDLVARDREALEAQLRAAMSEGERDVVPFIEQALRALDARATELLRDAVSQPEPVSTPADVRAPAIPEPAQVPAYSLPAELEPTPAVPADSPFTLFFQAADGSRVFMSSINARMLLHEYGTMDKCPAEVVGPVLELEELSLNDEARKKYRYLSHLPKSTEFAIAELDLSKYLSPQTLSHFADELQQRARRRKQRQQKERALQRRQEREQSKETRRQIDARDLTQFPDVSTTYAADSLVLEVPDTALAAAAPLPSGIPSFAQAAARRSAAAPAPAATVSPSRPMVKFVPLSTARRPQQPTGSGSEDDDGVRAPTFQSSFTTALLESLSSREPSETQPQVKEGKKKGKKLLFATTSQRRD